ncbi:MAG: SMC-Scp complex subunit ScpB [Eubacteriales bacterium]|nr:SMC-Scp complex subunit ScpB [Eubacteriales bacterium]
MDIEKAEGIIEAILFATGDSISLKNIAIAIEKDEKITKEIMDNLINKYNLENRGIKILQIEDSFQMCTNPEFFSYIKGLYSIPQKKTLSQTLLETLAIIAYKQPITKAQIENIRGVNSDHSVNTLVKYGLIEEKGRLDVIGKPILFGTTEEFLKYFGFSNLNQMPPLEDDEVLKKAVEEELN